MQKNYDTKNATFEEKYNIISLPMYKKKLCIYEFNHHNTTKNQKKKPSKVNKIMSYQETSMVHITKSVIFKPHKLIASGNSNEYVAQAPINTQSMI